MNKDQEVISKTQETYTETHMKVEVVPGTLVKPFISDVKVDYFKKEHEILQSSVSNDNSLNKTQESVTEQKITRADDLISKIIFID